MIDEKRLLEMPGEEAEVHMGEGKSIAKHEALKHLRRQHPKRDIPRVDEDQLEAE